MIALKHLKVGFLYQLSLHFILSFIDLFQQQSAGPNAVFGSLPNHQSNQQSSGFATRPFKITGLDHLVLTVQDLDKTVEFYTKVLGMEATTFRVRYFLLLCSLNLSILFFIFIRIKYFLATSQKWISTLLLSDDRDIYKNLRSQNVKGFVTK